MKRIQAFELHELSGCPDVVRRLATDYLHTVGRAFRAFEPAAPLLAGALVASRERRVVDLCSGGTGPVVELAEWVKARRGLDVSVVLSDLFPNQDAFADAAARSTVPVVGELEPVDARRVPGHLTGVRTLFDAFHHFAPDDARGILRDAAEQRAPLLVVEATERSLTAVVGMLLVVPLLVLVLTPFIRPFRAWRLALTYVIPIAIPLIVFDGIISCLRSYTRAELIELTSGLGHDPYQFHVGTLDTRGGRLTYLVGSPGPLPAGTLPDA